MAWLDAYIEKCPGFSWEGAPNWNTQITRLKNKRTRRNSDWSQPEWRFSVPFNANFPEHYDQVMDMFMVCRGRKNFFRVRNWLRYNANGWRFGTGDGVTQEFQLGKLITVDGVSVLEEFHALSLDPAAPTVVAYVNGTPASATFNNRTGRVLFDTPPTEGALLTWSGWFDYWVAFASDDFPASIDNKTRDGSLLTTFTAELEEVEPPDEDFSS